MLPIRAYALSAAIVASLATWAFLQFPGLLIWGAFIGWAGFLHSGGESAVMVKAITCMVFGVFMAWLFSVLIAGGYLGLSLPLAAALLVAIMAPFMVWISKIPLFSIVPASFYGFAACFAYLAQTAGKFTSESLTVVGFNNVLVVVSVSLVIGVCLGRLQTVLAGMLIAKSSA